MLYKMNSKGYFVREICGHVCLKDQEYYQSNKTVRDEFFMASANYIFDRNFPYLETHGQLDFGIRVNIIDHLTSRNREA